MSAQQFLQLKAEEKRAVFQNIATERVSLPESTIEKDWWVTQTLRLIFQLPEAEHIVFKGGTSLSKAWQLIDRFSEDVDLAINHKYLGFSGELSREQADKKLRKSAHTYIVEQFVPRLNESFLNEGFESVNLYVPKENASSQDPLSIEISYPRVTNQSSYLVPPVLVEIGGRSLHEPYSHRPIQSFVDEHFAGRPFASKPFSVQAVTPERTLLEKLFLLHEEFARPEEKRRVNRLSRHLYDIQKIGSSTYFDAAKNPVLQRDIIEHRRLFNRIGSVNYDAMYPPNLNPIPPKEQWKAWESDYRNMAYEMFNGNVMSFDQLMLEVQKITDQINQTKRGVD